MVKRIVFLKKPMHQYRAFQWEEHAYDAQSQKELSLLEEAMFSSFNGWTLNLRKMVDGKAFLKKPKHQYHVSQWRERVCDIQSEKE